MITIKSIMLKSSREELEKLLDAIYNEINKY